MNRPKYPPCFVDDIALSDDELETANKVFSLRFLTGDVHKQTHMSLKAMICDTLEIDSEDFLSLYKYIGSGNTFYLEVEESCKNADWQHKDFRLPNGLHFTVEDARAPRTTIRLESVPVGTSDKTLIKYFTKFLQKDCTVEEIKIITNIYLALRKKSCNETKHQ